MTEILIHAIDKIILIPSSWDEMTDENVRFVFQTLDDSIRTQKSTLDMNILILYHLMNVEFSNNTRLTSKLFPDRAQRIAENTFRLCQECLDFLFKEKEDRETVELSYNLIRNSLPVLKTRSLIGRLLVGPAEALQDLTFGEFRRAIAAHQAFFKSKDVADLDEMIAHLYRPRSRKANKAGRFVKPLRTECFAKEVEKIASIDSWKKNLILMWFSNCINFLQTGKLTINGEEMDMAALFSGGSDAGGPSFGWNDLAIQIARDNIVGNVADVDEEPLFSIISIMWTNNKENKKYESLHKAAKSK